MRLFLKEQPDQRLHCLLLHVCLHFLDTLLYFKTTMFNFKDDYNNFSDV